MAGCEIDYVGTMADESELNEEFEIYSSINSLKVEDVLQ
jgi:hypothetical protein